MNLLLVIILRIVKGSLPWIPLRLLRRLFRVGGLPDLLPLLLPLLTLLLQHRLRYETARHYHNFNFNLFLYFKNICLFCWCVCPVTQQQGALLLNLSSCVRFTIGEMFTYLTCDSEQLFTLFPESLSVFFRGQALLGNCMLNPSIGFKIMYYLKLGPFTNDVSIAGGGRGVADFWW